MNTISEPPTELLEQVFHATRGQERDTQDQVDPLQCWCKVNRKFRDLGCVEMYRHPTIGFPDLPSFVWDYIQVSDRQKWTQSIRIIPRGGTHHVHQPPRLLLAKDAEVRALTQGMTYQHNLLKDLRLGAPSAYFALLLIMLRNLKHLYLEGIEGPLGLRIKVNEISILNNLFPEPQSVPGWPSKSTWIRPHQWKRGYGDEVLAMIAPKLKTLEMNGSLVLEGTFHAYMQARYAPYLPPLLSLKCFSGLRRLEIPYSALLDRPVYGTPIAVEQLPATLRYLKIARVPMVNALSDWLNALFEAGCTPELCQVDCELNKRHLGHVSGHLPSLSVLANAAGIHLRFI
jgi:hypothetical protein